MEAVPKLPLLYLQLKSSPEPTDFTSNIKQYIRNFYNEDPEAYNKEIHDLETLRQAACRVPRDFTGCSTLKKYYAQLQLLQSRFPLKDGSGGGLSFSWNDIYSGDTYRTDLVRDEQACILHNIGALHTELGAMDSRQTSEGMKISCTHFQCAAWAFQYLRDNFPKGLGADLSPELLSYYVNVMLGQAQECILEKSMLDNRKSTIVAKIASQIVEYYRLALKSLDGGGGNKSPDGGSKISTIVGQKLYKSWKKHLEFKTAYHTCVTYLYMGNQAEELQKMGERVTYYQGAMDKLTESVKLAKGLDKDVGEALTFTMDIVGGKFNGASKENDFVYHEKVPAIDSLPEVKGASLVKGIPFDPADPEISGPDIFARLVPMDAHKASSVYSEEKAKLLRQIGTAVAEKDQELKAYSTSMQLDQLQLNPEPDRLPQELVDCCAAISVRPTAIKDLVVAMQGLSGMYHDVDSILHEAESLLQDEERQEKEYGASGQRPPSMIILDIKKELAKYQEAHQKASDSNVTLHKAMDYHIANLNLLSGSLDELELVLPSANLVEAPADDAGQQIHRLVDKVKTMQSQRQMLESQLREQIHADDITKLLVTVEDQDRQELFEREIHKHDRNVALLNQNLAAQDNILKALTEANARYADTRMATVEINQRRQNMIRNLIASYEAYEDLVSKSQKGMEFYRKLESNATKLLQRARSVCKVQQEEREKLAEKRIDKPAAKPPAAKYTSPSHGGPKLKDYLMANSGSAAGGGGGSVVAPPPQFAISDTASMSEVTEALKSMLEGGSHAGGYYARPASQSRAPLPSLDGRRGLGLYADAETANIPSGQRPAPVGSEQTDIVPSSYHSYASANRRAATSDYNPKNGTTYQTQLYNYQQQQQQVSNFQPTPYPANAAVYREMDNFKHAQQRNDLSNDAYYAGGGQPSTPYQALRHDVGEQYVSNKPSSSYLPPSSASASHQAAQSPQPSYYTSSVSNYPGVGQVQDRFSPMLPSPTHSQSPSPYPGSGQTGQREMYANATFAPSQQPHQTGGYTAGQYGAPSSSHQPQPQQQLQQQKQQQQQHQQPVSYPPGGLGVAASVRETPTPPGYSSIYSSSYASSSTMSHSSTSGGQQVSSSTVYPQTSGYGALPPATYQDQQQQQYGPATSGSIPNSASNASMASSQTNYYIQQGVASTADNANAVASQYQQSQQHYQQQLQFQQQQQQYLQLTQQQYPATSFSGGDAVPNYYMPAQQPLQPQTVGTPTSTYTQSGARAAESPAPQGQQPANVPTSNLDLLTQLDLGAPPTSVSPPAAQTILVPKSAAPKQHSSPPPAVPAVPPLDKSADTTDVAKPVVLKPLVVAAAAEKKIEEKLEEGPQSRRAAKDPFSDKESLVKFSAEVDRFQKVVEGLCKQSLNGPTPLDQKWKELMDAQDRESRKLSISVARCYSLKNRVPDIMPYDGNRVKIATLKDDYINASHVRSLSRHTANYITTQAPLPSTYGDFWTMVMEQQVEVVAVLITDAELKGDTYWPTDRGQVLAFGALSLNLQSCRTKPWGFERVIMVTQRETRNSRVVMHLQFTEWPPGGIPSSPAQFLHFVTDVQGYHRDQRSLSHPIVVHCSTGVGRTGVLCVVSAAMHEINAGSGIVDAWSLAATMTQIRKYAMQDKEHMRFALHALLYFAEDCLLKCGILIKRASFDDKVAGSGLKKSSHIRHPSQDFILNAGHEEPTAPATTNGSSAGSTKGQSSDREDGDSERLPTTNPTDAGRSRSNSSASVASVASSVSSSGAGRPAASPRHEQAAAGLPPSLAHLDAANFTLDPPTSSTRGRKITKESFSSGSGGGLLDKQQAVADPGDPLSLLDPLWTLHK